MRSKLLAFGAWFLARGMVCEVTEDSGLLSIFALSEP